MEKSNKVELNHKDNNEINQIKKGFLNKKENKGNNDNNFKEEKKRKYERNEILTDYYYFVSRNIIGMH